MNAHQRTRKPPVEPPISVHMRTESRRNTAGEHLDDTAEGVAFFVRKVHLSNHGGGCLGVKAAQRVGVEHLNVGRSRPRSPLRHSHRAECNGVGNERDSQFTEECPRYSAERNPSGGLPRACPFQNRTRLSEPILLHTDKVCVTGARASEQCPTATTESVFGDRLSTHDLVPLGPFGVTDAQGHRAAECEPVSHPTRECQLILFKLHARSAAVAQFAASKISPHLIERDWDTGGKSLENRNKLGAVRLSGGEPSKHPPILP